MKRKIKRKTTEYYVSGQKKMVVEYRGDWNSGEFVVKKHYDYDESGNLMKFKNQFDRLEFLDMNYKKVINLEKKDFSDLWRCALAIKKLIKSGDLDFSVDDGYKWAARYCTVDNKPIKDFKLLKQSYENAIELKIDKVLKFETL